METSKCQGFEPQMKRSIECGEDANHARKGSYSESSSRRQLVSGHGSQFSTTSSLGTAKLQARGHAHAAGRVSVPKPLNLPSLRKEHGVNPTTQLVPCSGNKSRWSKIYHDPDDGKKLANCGIENSAEPDTIMWNIKGSCEMRMHNNPQSSLKSRVDVQSILNAHEYPRLGSPTKEEAAFVHNKQSPSLSRIALQRSPDASRFESRRWHEDEREFFPLSGYHNSWFDDDTFRRHKICSHNSRDFLAQDLTDLPGMPGQFSTNQILTSHNEAHIPRSVLDAADEDIGYPNLHGMKNQSSTAYGSRPEASPEQDPEREAFHAELERVAARMEQVNKVGIEVGAVDCVEETVASCCSPSEKDNLSHEFSFAEIPEITCTKTGCEKNAMQQWQLGDNNDCWNQVAGKGSALEVIAAHSDSHTAEEGTCAATSTIANDGRENLISPPGHMGISWGSQGVFGPCLLAAASSETQEELESDLHAEMSYESKFFCSAKSDRKENPDSFGDVSNIAVPARQLTAYDAGVQSEQLASVPGSSHEEAASHYCLSAEDIPIDKCVLSPLRNIYLMHESGTASDGSCSEDIPDMGMVMDDFGSLNVAKTDTKGTGKSTRSMGNETSAPAISGGSRDTFTISQHSKLRHSQHSMYSSGQTDPQQNLVYFSNDVLPMPNPQQNSVMQTDMPATLYEGLPLHQTSMGHWHGSQAQPPQISMESNVEDEILPWQKEFPLAQNPLTCKSEVMFDDSIIGPATKSYYADTSEDTDMSSVHAVISNVENVTGSLIHEPPGMTPHSTLEDQGNYYSFLGQHSEKNPSKQNSVLSYSCTSFVMSGKRPDWSAPLRAPHSNIPFMLPRDGMEKSSIIGAPYANDETVVLEHNRSIGDVETLSRAGQQIEGTCHQLALDEMKRTENLEKNSRQMDYTSYCVSGLADVLGSVTDAESNNIAMQGMGGTCGVVDVQLAGAARLNDGTTYSAMKFTGRLTLTDSCNPTAHVSAKVLDE